MRRLPAARTAAAPIAVAVAAIVATVAGAVPALAADEAMTGTSAAGPGVASLTLPAGRVGLVSSALVPTADGRTRIIIVFGNGGEQPAFPSALYGIASDTDELLSIGLPNGWYGGEGTVEGMAGPTLLAPGGVGFATEMMEASVPEGARLLAGANGETDPFFFGTDPVVVVDSTVAAGGTIAVTLRNASDEMALATLVVGAVCLDAAGVPTAFVGTTVEYAEGEELASGASENVTLDLAGAACDSYLVAATADQVW